jgi:hypothetical protein
MNLHCVKYSFYSAHFTAHAAVFGSVASGAGSIPAPRTRLRTCAGQRCDRTNFRWSCLTGELFWKTDRSLRDCFLARVETLWPGTRVWPADGHPTLVRDRSRRLVRRQTIRRSTFQSVVATVRPGRQALAQSSRAAAASLLGSSSTLGAS